MSLAKLDPSQPSHDQSLKHRVINILRSYIHKCCMVGGNDGVSLTVNRAKSFQHEADRCCEQVSFPTKSESLNTIYAVGDDAS